MNKILVKICVPATNNFFDIFVPTDVPIKDVSRVIVDGIAEITNGKYIPSGFEQLCLKEPVGVLNPSLTLSDYGILDSMQLYVI